MSKQIFTNPVNFNLRIEQDLKNKVDANTTNKTEFINEAIREKLERGKK